MHVGGSDGAGGDGFGNAGGADTVEATLTHKLVVRFDCKVEIGAQRFGVVVTLVEEKWLQRGARLLRVRVAHRDEIRTPHFAMADASAKSTASAIEVEHGLCWPLRGVGGSQRLGVVGVEERSALDGVALAAAVVANLDVHGGGDLAVLLLSRTTACELGGQDKVARVIRIFPDADGHELVEHGVVDEGEEMVQGLHLRARELQSIPHMHSVASCPVRLDLVDGALRDGLLVAPKDRLGALRVLDQPLQVAAAVQRICNVIDVVALTSAVQHRSHMSNRVLGPLRIVFRSATRRH